MGLIFSPIFLPVKAGDVTTSSVTVEEISFTIDSNTVNLGSVTPAVSATGSSILSIATSNINGFSIKVKRNESDATLDLNDDSTINIPDRTTWDPAGSGNAGVWESGDRYLGFRVQQTDTDSGNYNSTWWGSDDSDSNAKFAGFPSTSQTIVNRTSSSTPATDSKVLYKLNVPNSQPTGDYSGGITYTVIVNP